MSTSRSCHGSRRASPGSNGRSCWAPGARLPRHEHVAIEQTYVLEGSFADHAGVCGPGQYVWRRAGSRHEAWTDEGCLMLAVFLKPNTFFD
jgi:anti-sigma factor ChrR (cupin superfamily)